MAVNKPSIETHDHGDAPGTADVDPENGQQNLKLQSTYMGPDAAAHLSQEHRDYLLQRHGTLELDPLPSADPADPYNWPTWKKNVNLLLVAFHACMTTFFAAGIIPAFGDMSKDLNTSIKRTSYLTSMQIAILGFAPLFWMPISNRFGRRPLWLISIVGSGVSNIGCAVSHTYASLAACRCLAVFFICPAMAIGSGVVVETFFKKERGQKMGIWALMITLGPPGGPFLMGFVANSIGYDWIFWIFAIINAVEFVAFFFFSPETRYLRQNVDHHGSTFKREYLTFSRIDKTPFKPIEFIQPLFLAKHMTILIPTISYSMVFGFCSIFLTVEIPEIFIPKFNFNPAQIGLQFLGMIIGSLIGELMGGPLSDFWMNRKVRALNKNNTPHTKEANGTTKETARVNSTVQRAPDPEYRLWLSYFGFVLAIVGLIVFGVRLQQLPKMQWDVTPIVGIAIAACGNQIITTVLVTYAVDCHHEHSSSIGVFINVIRSTWGFIGPFWFPNMIASLGEAGSGGLMAGLIFVVSVLPVLYIQFRGKKLRQSRAKREDDSRALRGD